MSISQVCNSLYNDKASKTHNHDRVYLKKTSQNHAAIADSLSSYGGSNIITIAWSTAGKIQFRVDGTLVKEI